MKNSDYNDFDGLLEMLARLYRIAKPDDETIAGYFKQLAFFSIEIVTEACERASGVHPSFFPRAGELIALCQNVVEEIREANKKREGSVRSDWQEISKCSHTWKHESEGDGNGLLTGFLVCVNCPAVKPVLNRDKMYSAQRAYLAKALSAKPEARQ